MQTMPSKLSIAFCQPPMTFTNRCHYSYLFIPSDGLVSLSYSLKSTGTFGKFCLNLVYAGPYVLFFPCRALMKKEDLLIQKARTSIDLDSDAKQESRGCSC